MRVIVNAETLNDQLTRPVYLVELGFAPTVYMSSGAEVSWGGYVWQNLGVDVSSLQTDTVGRSSATLSVSNLDRTFGSLVLSQAAKDRTAKIYVYYPEGSAGAIDPRLIVDGVMDGASVGQRVDINVISRASYFGSTPRIVCAPPTFNHLPPAGTVLNWGGVTLTLERR